MSLTIQIVNQYLEIYNSFHLAQLQQKVLDFIHSSVNMGRILKIDKKAIRQSVGGFLLVSLNFTLWKMIKPDISTILCIFSSEVLVFATNRYLQVFVVRTREGKQLWH